MSVMASHVSPCDDNSIDRVFVSWGESNSQREDDCDDSSVKMVHDVLLGGALDEEASPIAVVNKARSHDDDSSCHDDESVGIVTKATVESTGVPSEIQVVQASSSAIARPCSPLDCSSSISSRPNSTVLAKLVKKYPNHVPASLPMVPRKRSKPVCRFINYLGTRQPQPVLKRPLPIPAKQVVKPKKPVVVTKAALTPAPVSQVRVAPAPVSPVPKAKKPIKKVIKKPPTPEPTKKIKTVETPIKAVPAPAPRKTKKPTPTFTPTPYPTMAPTSYSRPEKRQKRAPIVEESERRRKLHSMVDSIWFGPAGRPTPAPTTVSPFPTLGPTPAKRN